MPKYKMWRLDAPTEVVSQKFLVIFSWTPPPPSSLAALDEIVMGERNSCTGWKDLILRARPDAT